MPIHSDRFIPWDAFDQFNFERFIRVFVMLNGAWAVPNFGAYGITKIDDLFHLFLDEAEVLWGKRLFAIKVIVPAVIDHRANSHFDVWPNLLNSARHDMCEVMTHQLKSWSFVLHRVDGDGRVFGDWPLHVPVVAVHGRRDRFFGKGCSNGCGHLSRGHACVIVAFVAIWKSERDLGHLCPPRLFGAHGTPDCGYIGSAAVLTCSHRRVKLFLLSF